MRRSPRQLGIEIAQGGAIVRIAAVKKAFGEVEAIRQLSFDVADGERRLSGGMRQRVATLRRQADRSLPEGQRCD
jgi:hypothetical protein